MTAHGIQRLARPSEDVADSDGEHGIEQTAGPRGGIGLHENCARGLPRGECAGIRPHVEVDPDGSDTVSHAQRPADPLTLAAAEVEQPPARREQAIEQSGH